MRNDTPTNPTPGEGRTDGPNPDAGQTKPRDPDCFEQWLCERMLERRDREDEVGCVARWVLRENTEGRWVPGPVLLARHGHAYDVPAHYERILKHAVNFSEEAAEAFFRVYDLYLKDDGAAFDRMVEERGRRLDEEFAEAGNGGGGGVTAPGAGASEDGSEASYSWESSNRFFYELHGREGLGYDVDEDWLRRFEEESEKTLVSVADARTKAQVRERALLFLHAR